jgi:hypothetical protein
VTASPYDAPLSILHDSVEDLAVAVAIWETRDDTKPQPEVRQAANTAIDAIDAQMRELYLMRARLVGEIREADDATAARADALLGRSRQDAAQVTEAGDG